MNDQNIYIYNPYKGSNGISIIVRNLCKSLRECGKNSIIIDNLNDIPLDAVIIPYGYDGAIDMVKKGYKLDFVFMADAFTLGYLNKIKFYLKHIDIFHYDFFYSIYCYIRDIKSENLIISKFKNTILVSESDIDYLRRKKSSKTNYIYLPNGANFVEVLPKTNSNVLRLGILSSWGHTVTAKENGWFIENYFGKYVRVNPNVKLILAGRGDYIHQFDGIKNVEVLGEVEDLNDFFKNIDVFIAVNPKGCGILNRVLDAFVYKTPVIGYIKAFSGFRYMKNAYLGFSNYKTFESQLNKIASSQELRDNLANNAYSQIVKHNDWNKLYSDFVNKHFV